VSPGEERTVLDREMLARVGLRHREPVRYRRNDSQRWHTGTMRGLSADGSLTIHDRDGAARNLRPECIEVRRPGARGQLTWQAVADIAVTWEQLGLF
jgi:hypothetical protein